MNPSLISSQTTCIQTVEINSQDNLEKKIDSITRSLSRPYYNTILKNLLKSNYENAKTIYEHIVVEQTELNIKNSTIEGKLRILVWLSNFHNDNKLFIDMTKYDILGYLNNLRKTPSQDPSNKWVGTYNGRQTILLKFFRWLYSPNEDYKNRSIPECMKGIRKLPRKEKTSYKPSDIWDSRDHALFLKYCPYKRDRCYHALASDMSARPHEILNLKVKDIIFKITEDGIQYAEARITQGKTGPRTVPLIDSIPYVKEWLEEHPNGNNSDSFIFISLGNNYGSNLTLDGLSSHYDYYKTKYFPNLLNDITIPEKDKTVVKNMLTKPWNLYVFRHSALTEKSMILPESILKDHAGWTMSSKMTQIYIHLSGESSKVLLQKRGVLRKEDMEVSDTWRPKFCSNCNEPNKIENKFCIKCRMVLSFDSYMDTLKEQKSKDEERIKRIEERYQNDMKQMKIEIENKLQEIRSRIDLSKV
ncbi:MAG: site-specific integrase [Candidatus Nitrosocosmicus sp.]|nr:site-specific integrase [Candidatus Nitrosocosmicus sp.]MDN5866292.1 site-specific integrase [Candidatus Nitrosocosmicus sp.]